MIRLSLYITLAILLALGAVWFADHPGRLQLNWQGWEVRMSMAIFCLLVLIYTLACLSLFRLYRWFRTDNPLTSPKRRESRRNKGLVELDLGWSALAVQDRDSALKHGRKALTLLPGDNGPLRLLIEAATDTDREKYLSQLNQNPKTRMVALRSRLDQALAAGNNRDALTILQEMHQLSPGNPWIMTQLFDIQTRLGNWAEAREALTRIVKARAMEAAEQKRLSAVLCYSQALEADLANQKAAARKFAKEALKNDPAFVPAALLLARHYLAQDDRSKARKVIESAWKITPHPDLGQLFLELVPMESPSEKIRRTRKFASLNSDHPHSLHLLARVGLDTEHWADAKQALDKLLAEGRASRETYHLLARLEMLQRQDKSAAEDHMTRAAHAPADPIWQCDKCNAPLENYSPSCPNCQTFGHISWRHSL